MRTFRLKLRGDHIWAGKEIEFEGDSPASALDILKTERGAGFAELWCDGERILELARSRSGLWQIGSPA